MTWYIILSQRTDKIIQWRTITYIYNISRQTTQFEVYQSSTRYLIEKLPNQTKWAFVTSPCIWQWGKLNLNQKHKQHEENVIKESVKFIKCSFSHLSLSFSMWEWLWVMCGDLVLEWTYQLTAITKAKANNISQGRILKSRLYRIDS